MLKLYRKTTPFYQYIRDLSKCRVQYPQGSWNQSPRILRDDCGINKSCNTSPVVLLAAYELMRQLVIFCLQVNGALDLNNKRH